MEGERMKVLSMLWAADIAATMYTGTNSKLLPQMKKAKGIPLTVIVGGDEMANGQVRIKFTDDAAKDDVAVAYDKLAETVAASLKDIAAPAVNNNN